MRSRLLLARLARSTCGTAAAELALIFPMVGFITLNVVDVAVFAYSKMQVDLAAQQAVGVARVECIKEDNKEYLEGGTCGTQFFDKMLDAAHKTTLDSDVSLIGAPAEQYYCADDAGLLTLVATPPSAPPDDCSAVVSGSTAAPGSYISATTSYTYTSIFPSISVASLLSNPIQATAWMRLQ